MRIEIMDGQTVINTINADEAFAEANYPGAWRVVPDTPAPAPVNQTEWLIDIGTFFDRFGAGGGGGGGGEAGGGSLGKGGGGYVWLEFVAEGAV